MSTSFIWTVNTLERTTSDNIVFTVHYGITASDDTYQASSCGSINLDAPAEGDTVIPYADLTEEVVVGWVKAKLGEQQVVQAQNVLEYRIDEQRTPTTATGTPWS